MAWTPEQKKQHRLTCVKPDCWCNKKDTRKRPEHDNRKRVRFGKGRVDPDFIAIDGEAIGESGYHLLAASTGDQIENLDGLSSEDCIRFLLSLREKNGPAIYVGFALGYDCEHWIRDFGPAFWQSLRDTGEATIKIDGWKRVVQYIPRKWFKIGYYPKGSDQYTALVEVFDLFSFFQTSFVSVVGSASTGQPKGWNVATRDEMEVLVDWKAKRGAFALEDWDDIVRYNQIECAVLVRLANKLRGALHAADIRLRSWHGPGAVANALLKKYGMEEHIVGPPQEVEEAISRAYFGGRFQVFQLGHINGVYDYDISSAYPYATTLLPSTKGEWVEVCEYQGEDVPWVVYEVTWKVEGPLTPFPWRDADGLIHYPLYGRGWYWAWEVTEVLRGFGAAIRVERGYRLYPQEEGVFHWMNELAANRVAAKQKAKTAEGEEKDRLLALEKVYKLALNSVYGKTIQTVGKHRPFLCAIWAGLITANTRSRLLANALKAPSSVVCFATDGLFSDAPIAVEPLGSNLGDWELAETDIRLELYKSGCYSIWKDGELKDSRFRGIARSEIDWGKLREAWEHQVPSVSIPTKRFVGHRTALREGKPEIQATWVTRTKEEELRPGVGTFLDIASDFGKPIVKWLSHDPRFSYNECSAPYRKLVEGETEAELEEVSVQP